MKVTLYRFESEDGYGLSTVPGEKVVAKVKENLKTAGFEWDRRERSYILWEGGGRSFEKKLKRDLAKSRISVRFQDWEVEEEEPEPVVEKKASKKKTTTSKEKTTTKTLPSFFNFFSVGNDSDLNQLNQIVTSLKDIKEDLRLLKKDFLLLKEELGIPAWTELEDALRVGRAAREDEGNGKPEVVTEPEIKSSDQDDQERDIEPESEEEEPEEENDEEPEDEDEPEEEERPFNRPRRLPRR